MNDSQMLILSCNSFDAKAGYKCNVLETIGRDNYGHFKASSQFVNEECFKNYTGPGVYDVSFIPYYDKNGVQKAKLSMIKKVKAVDF